MPSKPKHKGGRPPLPEGDRRQQWTGRLPPITIDRIRMISTIYGCSQADVVAFAVKDWKPQDKLPIRKSP